MLSLPPSVRIWISHGACDMRRSFDGLAHLVREVIGQDPLSGHLFVFRNRQGNRLKVLWWDRDGYALWYKRLEKGSFSLPETGHGERHSSITASQLQLIVDGIDLRSVKRRARYELPPKKSVT
jgi:transposase